MIIYAVVKQDLKPDKFTKFLFKPNIAVVFNYFKFKVVSKMLRALVKHLIRHIIKVNVYSLFALDRKF